MTIRQRLLMLLYLGEPMTEAALTGELGCKQKSVHNMLHGTKGLIRQDKVQRMSFIKPCKWGLTDKGREEARTMAWKESLEAKPC